MKCITLILFCMLLIFELYMDYGTRGVGIFMSWNVHLECYCNSGNFMMPLNMAIEIVSFPMKNVISHSYVKLPEGIHVELF